MSGDQEADWDGWAKPMLDDGRREPSLHEIIELEAAYQSRIAELVEVLNNAIISNNPQFYYIAAFPVRQALLSRTDNIEALNEYRNQVIEECALSANKTTGFTDSIVVERIRALKKGKV